MKESTPEQVVAQVRAILDPGPWQIVTDLTVQGYALWEVLGKLDDHTREEPARKHPGPLQCTGCGAIFGGESGSTSHRTGMRCNDPLASGYERNAKGVWREPLPEVSYIASFRAQRAEEYDSGGSAPTPEEVPVRRRITPGDVVRLREACRVAGLTPPEARAMDALLQQQAMTRGRTRAPKKPILEGKGNE